MAKKVTENKSKEKDGFKLNETSKEDAMPAAQTLLVDGRLPKIIGLLLILISLFVGIALTSYFSTWQADQDKVFNYTAQMFFNAGHYHFENKLGSLGAFISHQLIFNGIGIAAYAFALLFFTWGFNLVAQKRVFPILKIAQTTLLAAFWLTTFLSFVMNDAAFSWGGAMGNFLNSYLQGFAGWAGTALILVVSFLMFLVAVYNIGFKLAVPAFITNLLERRAAAKYNAEDLSTVKNVVIDNAMTHEAEIILKDYKVAEVVPQEPKREDNVFKENSLNDGVAFEVTRMETPVEAPVETPDNVDDFMEEEEAFAGSIATPAVPIVPIVVAPIKPDPMDDFEVISPASPTSKETNPVEENVQLDIAPVTTEPEATVETVANSDKYDPTLDLSHYKFPPLDLLQDYVSDGTGVTKDELEQNKNQIVNTLRNYGIEIDKIKATIGPTVTLYEIVPAAGVRISKIKNLEDDIALSLSALGIRIIAPIPGKGTIGIEVPNIKKELVSMRSLLGSEKFAGASMDLPIALGKNIANENIVVDLAKMPHLLMAGATGQGKSVGLNAILVSLLYKKHPSQLKFVMVDPKKVELSIYKIIENHFLAKLPNEEDPIITDTKKVVATLNSLCLEMDRRYDLLKDATCRNLKEYNQKFIDRRLNPLRGHEFLPYIVVVIDEFADLIMTAGKEVEIPIARIAQLARAVGIHLIIATQRPSVNIITGTIKANFPARIAFKVSSKIDSRTILDAGGADQLIGKGDMLLSNGGELIRIQCAFCDTPEIEKIVEYISKQQGYPSAHLLPEYIDPNDAERGDLDLGTERDEYFEEAAKTIVAIQQGSTSMIQRKLKLGYNRAGRIMDQLEAAGIVGPAQGSKPREVRYKTEADLLALLNTLK
jgi:S-DNA-T family DNA segregation ATPase FtsK/SpoIIIE